MKVMDLQQLWDISVPQDWNGLQSNDSEEEFADMCKGMNPAIDLMKAVVIENNDNLDKANVTASQMHRNAAEEKDEEAKRLDSLQSQERLVLKHAKIKHQFDGMKRTRGLLFSNWKQRHFLLDCASRQLTYSKSALGPKKHWITFTKTSIITKTLEDNSVLYMLNIYPISLSGKRFSIGFKDEESLLQTYSVMHQMLHIE